MKLHSAITLDRVAKAVQQEETTLDNPGSTCCDCDAEGHTCDQGGQPG